MGLLTFFFKEKTKHKDILEEQKYLEKLIRKSILLFKEEEEWYDENDYYHYYRMEYYLTPQNNLISQKTTGHRDGHNALYGSQLVFRRYITFQGLAEAIKNSSLAEAKRFEGITKDNCRDYISRNK